jgi:hypothetical protein
MDVRGGSGVGGPGGAGVVTIKSALPEPASLSVLGISTLWVLGCACHARHQAAARAVRLDIQAR